MRRDDAPILQAQDAEHRREAGRTDRHRVARADGVREPISPIAAFAPESSWHISSVSKILSPGLRVAWLRAPGVAQAWRLAADMHETAVMAPPLNTAIVADWVVSGVFDRAIDEVRREARARQDLVRRILPAGGYAAHAEGYYL